VEDSKLSIGREKNEPSENRLRSSRRGGRFFLDAFEDRTFSSHFPDLGNQTIFQGGRRFGDFHRFIQIVRLQQEISRIAPRMAVRGIT